MKRLFLTLIVLFLSGASFAAEPDKAFEELLFKAKAQEMKKELELSDKKFEKFLPVFKSYEYAMSNSYKKNNPTVPYSKAIEKNLTHEQVIVLIDAKFTGAEDILTIKKKYLPEFSAILSNIELLKFYKTETNIRSKIKKEINDRIKEQAKK